MFKKGDVVICLDSEQTNDCLTQYKEYIVLGVDVVQGQHPMLMIIDDTGLCEEYYAFRFTLEPTRESLIKIMFANIK